MKKQQYWNDYWQSDGQAGEVLQSQDGNKPAYLVEFWKNLFASLDPCAIHDLACGAGSIYESVGLDLRQGFTLYGVDVSKSALDILHSRMPEVTTIQAGSEALPFESHSLDYCVSQFGIEYSGLKGFEELTRVLKKGGRGTFLCHIEDGYIDQRNKKYLDGAKLILSSNYFEAARALTEALFAKKSADIESCTELFNRSEALLASEVGSNVNGIHDHLYHGFRQLKSRYSAYHESDIVAWLDAMEADVAKNIHKVSNIREVSLNKDTMSKINEIFMSAGFSGVSFSEFFGNSNQSLPVAVKLEIHN